MRNSIIIEHLSVTVDGQEVLRDIALSLPVGKVIGLLGPSGAGKTTLMRTVVGLQRPSAGTVTVLDRPAGNAELRREIGYVTQAPSVYRDLTVIENLKYFAAMTGVSKTRAEEVLELVRLTDRPNQLAGRLSGGQLARVSLAAALLGNPRLLVLDEPTVGLDPVLRHELWDQFHALAGAGTTLLVSSHVMDEARRCDGLVLLREGRSLATGTPAALMAKTHTHDIETSFLKLVEGQP